MKTKVGSLTLKAAQAGFTYLMVLVLLFLLGLAQVKVSETWQMQVQREREQALLAIGNEFRVAIGRYYEQSPGTLKRYPRSLNDLLSDGRFLGVRRHLRRVYADPMTNRVQWGTVPAPDGGIMGVFSLSDAHPYRQAGFVDVDVPLAGASTYRQWRFIYEPSRVLSPVGG